MEKRGGHMKRNEAEQREANELMYRQQLLRQRAILLDQRRQLPEEKQVHMVAVSARLQKPQDRLGQEERVECVFACLRGDLHGGRHIAGPIGILGEATPDQSNQCQSPDGYTDRSMELQNSRMGGSGRGEIDGKREYEDE